jgi:polysaccharide biosynthesis transport protein
MNERHIVDEARQWIAVIHKRRVLVATCTGVALVVALIYNQTARPVYRATAQILIGWTAPDILPQKSVFEAPTGSADYFQTHYQLLNSRPLAEHVVEQLRLDQAAESQQSSPSLWRALRRNTKAPGGQGDANDAAADFRSRLKIEPVPGTRLVNVHFSAYDPAIAARAVNALVQTYIEQALDLRISTSAQATDWLAERLVEQQAKVAQAERAVQAYREREGLVNQAERQSLTEQKLAALTSASVGARTERIEREALLNQLRSIGDDEILSLPVVKSNKLIEELRAQLLHLREQEAQQAETLGDRHPELVALRARIARAQEKLTSEVREVVRSVEAEHQAVARREGQLLDGLADAKREALALGRKVAECQTLEREAESQRKLLDDLMGRSKETNLESALKMTNLRIVERAGTPQTPMSPRKARNYQLALLFGLGLGIALAVLIERLDNTVRTPEDIKNTLHAPFLGMIPESVRAADEPARSVLVLDPQSPAAEAYRVLRTNLMFSSAETTGRVFMISSANPSEGKTTTVANLALALAQNGARVLAVDADLRRPTLHQHFALEKAPGLSDVIVANASLLDAVQPTHARGLQILPCGYVPPNPTELLGSGALKDIIAVLRKRFDWVLFDAPPFVGMADAPVLGTLMDGIVLVTWAERSGRPAIQRSIDQISAVGGKLTGIVLNRVDLDRNSYYYSQYYGEYYRSYKPLATEPKTADVMRSVSRN